MLFLSRTACFVVLNFCTFSTLLPSNGLWSQIAPRMTSNMINPSPTNQQLLQLCTCNALSQHGIFHPEIDDELLQTLDSVNIFSHVVPNIEQTNLFCGYLVFTKNFTQITDNLAELQKRQFLTTYLQEHEELFHSLDQLIKNLQYAEIKTLWHFYPQRQQVSLPQQGILKTIINLYTSAQKTKNNNRFLNEFWTRTKHASIIGLSSYAASFLYDFKANCKKTENSWNTYFDNLSDNGKIITINGKTYSISKKSIGEPASNIYVAYTAYQSLIYLTALINLSLSIKHDFDDAYDKQQLLIALNNMLTTTQKIDSTLDKHPEIKQLFPEYQRIKQLAHYQTTSNADISIQLKNFLNLLNSSSFSGTPNYYLSFQGKIQQTYNQFLEVKHELIPFFEALGHIDAQLCIVKILQHKSSQHTHFCQPTWIQSELPELSSVNFWHPMLPTDKVISNSIYLGNQYGAANAIITGSNAGGKTTALSAIMIGQIMAQSLGIAPAQSLTCTPFAKLHTYLDITTNLTNNESLFMAQANRAEKLQKSILACSSGQKSLSILDEIFTGTRADFASQASFEFARALGSIPHSICILATHFPQLTDLEALKLFVNYKTQDAIITPQGTLVYPYKIVPGISDQNIAQHILQKKGIIKQVANHELKTNAI